MITNQVTTRRNTMIFKIITMLVIGLSVFGIFTLINKMLGGVIPRWIMPACIALSLVSYHVYDEYTWAKRTMTGIENKETPFRLLEARTDTALWRPWGYIFPMTTELDVVLENSLTDAEDGTKEAVMIRYIHPGMTTTLLMKYSCEDKAYALKIENEGRLIAYKMSDMMKSTLCDGKVVNPF